MNQSTAAILKAVAVSLDGLRGTVEAFAAACDGLPTSGVAQALRPACPFCLSEALETAMGGTLHCQACGGVMTPPAESAT